MAAPKLPDDIRVYVMEQLDIGTAVLDIVEEVQQKTGLPHDQVKLCVSAIKGQHTKGYRPRVKGPSTVGQVYFIQGETTKNIKIGFSTDPADRVRQHQTGSAEKLSLLASVEGDQALETELQRKFDDLRVHGEWFSPGEKLLEYINSIKNSDMLSDSK